MSDFEGVSQEPLADWERELICQHCGASCCTKARCGNDGLTDAEPPEVIRLTHDDIAEIAFNVINTCDSEGIHDSLRQAHAIAVALKLAEADR